MGEVPRRKTGWAFGLRHRERIPESKKAARQGDRAAANELDWLPAMYIQAHPTGLSSPEQLGHYQNGCTILRRHI